MTKILRFGLVGAAGAVIYAGTFLLLQAFLPGQVANFAALLISAVANTAANRRFTFGVRGARDATRHHLQGLLIFLAGWAVTSGALGVLDLAHPTASPGLTLATLVGANLALTVVRFVLLNSWVFRKSVAGATIEV